MTMFQHPKRKQINTWCVAKECHRMPGYKAWNENFDVAVTLSSERCLMEAVDLDAVDALRRCRSKHDPFTSFCADLVHNSYLNCLITN